MPHLILKQVILIFWVIIHLGLVILSILWDSSFLQTNSMSIFKVSNLSTTFISKSRISLFCSTVKTEVKKSTNAFAFSWSVFVIFSLELSIYKSNTHAFDLDFKYFKYTLRLSFTESAILTLCCCCTSLVIWWTWFPTLLYSVVRISCFSIFPLQHFFLCTFLVI